MLAEGNTREKDIDDTKKKVFWRKLKRNARTAKRQKSNLVYKWQEVWRKCIIFRGSQPQSNDKKFIFISLAYNSGE